MKRAVQRFAGTPSRLIASDRNASVSPAARSTGSGNLIRSLSQYVNPDFKVSKEQISQYREVGQITLKGFLSPERLDSWRRVVDEAVADRGQQRFATGEEDKTNVDEKYYSTVFTQRVNLWQSHQGVADLWEESGPVIGRIACELEGCDAMRVWHDQALIKPPFASPTSPHTDNPYWSFSSFHAISLWVALDDVTHHNGALFFMPGSHRMLASGAAEGRPEHLPQSHEPKHSPFREIKIGSDMRGIFDAYPALLGDAAAPPLVAAPMKAGDVSLHNGLTVHGAGPNLSKGVRRAMTLQMMPAGTRRHMLDGAGHHVPMSPAWGKEAVATSGTLSQLEHEGVFNGKQNILADRRFQGLKLGDPLIPGDFGPAGYSPGSGSAAPPDRQFRTKTPAQIQEATPEELHPLLWATKGGNIEP